jgi:recombination protein RecA
MASVALTHLTTLLQAKKLDGTLTRPLSTGLPTTSTGVEALDQALAGSGASWSDHSVHAEVAEASRGAGVPGVHKNAGWPRGHVSEIVGPASSGRTSVVMATLASATARGGVVAFVDVADRFNPESAAEAGVDLDRLLWVRGPSMTWGAPQSTVGDLAVRRGLRAFDLIVRAGGFAVVVLDLADVPERMVRALPASTWLRLAHVIEGRDTVGLLVGTAPMGRSSGGVSLSLEGIGQWTGASAQSRRLSGVAVEARVARSAMQAGVARHTSGKAVPACFFASSETR